MTEEQKRLNIVEQSADGIVEWGPYLSERQWGTVREDYSAYGDAWNYFPFDHAHCRAYQWGEDGLAGISDRFQNLCFSLALWNGKDPILKERLFGLRNGEGNHGEDVKELYYYLDNTPSHSYMEFLYKYPQQEFPYQKLREENARRSKLEGEYELLDTGIFNTRRYFDVRVTYAKQSPTDILVRIDITNRYGKAAEISVLPTVWFSRQAHHAEQEFEPVIDYVSDTMVRARHNRLGDYFFYVQPGAEGLFTNNETNTLKVTGKPAADIYTKDAFHDAVIKGTNRKALREKRSGTKFAAVHRIKVRAQSTHTIYCRLSDKVIEQPLNEAPHIFSLRKSEADAYYASILPEQKNKDLARIQRQAIAGLLWSKQFYCFDVERWLNEGDGISQPDERRKSGRNHDWQHLKNQDIISMPDKWEYPWYAAWDLAFQSISMAAVDPHFAKQQLLLIMREWYMKPDGQLPAYEWNFSDVNPPVHAWAAFEVYQIDKKKRGRGDLVFLKKIFQKLLINFTWWINRKDRKGNNIFEGGFLGLDNIGVFNRSFHGGNLQLEQADGTSWMGTYALNMMDIALEIAQHDESFEDTATKFFEHFILIAESLNQHHLWSEQDKFFYDVLSVPGNEPLPLRIKSMVGLTSLFAVSTISRQTFERLQDFKKRSSWYENYRKKNGKFWPNEERGDGEEILLSLVPRNRLVYLLERLLDEEEFLSPGGVRALSKYHRNHPYSVLVEGEQYTISYDPGDSTSEIFGGNSNWRGPVWMPVNYLIIRSIRKYGEFYGDSLTVEYPVGSGQHINLSQAADELTRRIVGLFQRDEEGKRPLYGPYNWFYQQEGNRELVLFYEYFHGDTGQGLGASHQTGWTALVAELIAERADSETLQAARYMLHEKQPTTL